jgi:diaminopimelate epimerase
MASSFTLSFKKMHGLGNDFVMLDGKTIPADIHWPTLAAMLCDRHFGIGADGMIAVMPASNTDQFDLKFLYFNSDGSVAEMCGNGIRCFARFVVDEEIWPATIEDSNQGIRFRVETLAGLIIPTVNPDGSVTVDMGKPILTPSNIPFVPAGSESSSQEDFPVLKSPMMVQGQSIPVTPVSMGNPHCVVFQEDLPTPIDPTEFGPLMEKHSQWPAKTNVEFVRIKTSTELDVVVWERGCGFTLACGTGACATAVAAILNHKVAGDAPLQINLPGGPLQIEWKQPEGEQDQLGHVLMTGPAETVFKGSIEITYQTLTEWQAKLGQIPTPA